MNPTRPDVVSASEIASWAWCPEAWRLEAVGEAPANVMPLARGRTLHARMAAADVSTRRTLRAAGWFLAVALLLILVGAAFGLLIAGARR